MTSVSYPELHLYINGQRLSANGRSGENVLNPGTGESIGKLPHATESDLDHALESSAVGFNIWRRVSAYERAKVLRRAAELMRERATEIANIITVEQGKVASEALGEVSFTADVFEWFAEEGRRSYGRLIPSRGADQQFVVVREPVGPVLALAPWNFPALAPARKIAASLAAGCSCIIKPSEETPATTLALARVLEDAGLPAGVLNVVFGRPAVISEYLISSSIIRKISFTGSIAVGKSLLKLCADGIKRTTMELGGHAPVIITGDVDVERVAALAVAAKFRNAGQICVSPTRFFVHDSIHDKFVDQFAQAASSLRIGNGLEEGVQMGPLANTRRVDAMQAMCADAEASGARLVIGGNATGNRGYFWQPTLLADVPDNSLIMQHEPFGPVAVTARFERLDDAIAQANRLPYGLASYAFSESAKDQALIAEELECGLLGINSFVVTTAETPFGGVKQSGFGSEGGVEGLEAYLATKLITKRPTAVY